MGNVRRLLLEYGVAALAIVVTVLLRQLLDPILGENQPFCTLYGAVAIAVWYGGYRPALAATALGYLAANYLFIEPRGSVVIRGIGDVVRDAFQCRHAVCYLESERARKTWGCR